MTIKPLRIEPAVFHVETKKALDCYQKLAIPAVVEFHDLEEEQLSA